MTRRSVLQALPSAALMGAAPEKRSGRLRTRSSAQIASSPISIGFETLDRQMFEPERCYPWLAQTGVKWARCQTGWARTETRRGEYDFAWLDRVVDSLRGIGIQPWFNLGYGNTLYTPGPKHVTAVGWAPLNSAEARQSWVRYVAALAAHFSKRVSHFEVWNEANITNFWQPGKPDPAQYVELVKLTAPAVRQSAANSVLIGGVASPSDLNFFEGCFAAGLGDLVDKISIHSYSPVPEENYATLLRALRGMIRRYKPGLALWQGEGGAPSTNDSSGGLSNYEWDEARQAKWLLRRLLIDLSLGVEVTSYFHTVDMANYVSAAGPSTHTNTKGVLRSTDYTPKISYYALRNLCSLFDSETKAADFAFRVHSTGGDVEISAVQTATFARGKAPIAAFWYPANLQTGWRARNVRLSLWTGRDAEFLRPVLVDLLTGLVYPVPGDGRVVQDAILRDYPVLLTDESVCQV